MLPLGAEERQRRREAHCYLGLDLQAPVALPRCSSLSDNDWGKATKVDQKLTLQLL